MENTNTVVEAQPFEAQRTVVSNWFEEMIDSLSTHKLMYEEDVMSQELKQRYESIVFSGEDEWVLGASKAADKIKFGRAVANYFRLISPQIPSKLAFNYAGNKILVWAEIKDGDDAMAKHLMMTEAHANVHCEEIGILFDTFWVEENDKYPVPSHYVLLKPQK